MYSIYKITNIDNGRVYVGMTEFHITKRFRSHMNNLRAGAHVNQFMQDDFQKGHRFVIHKVGSRKYKETAKALETKLMNEEINPYNIAKGNPGDLIGFQGLRFTSSSRPYMYAEIIDMDDTPRTQMKTRYNVSHPMISMIKRGHRTAAEPQTSFRDVFFCDQTEVMADAPKQSQFVRVYLENINAAN